MNNEFRENVQNLADTAIPLVRKYFGGCVEDPTRIKSMMQAIGYGLKVEHMNQLKRQNDRSLALRTLRYLPDDEEIRKEYLKITNPELQDVRLLTRPNNKKLNKKK